MGACSGKPKTAEFEGSINFFLQEELAKKNLDDEQKGGCNAGLKSSDPEQKFSSKCSLQNLPPALENEHGSTEDVLLESEKEHLAGSSLENNDKETCVRAEEMFDGKPHFVAESESQVSEIGTDTSQLQKEKPEIGQELYEEPVFAPMEDVLRPRGNSILFKDVVELPQKVAFRNVENGKLQTLENINEDKELPMFEGVKPRIDAEDGNPVSCRALQEPVFLASRVANANLKLKINPAGNLTNCATENIAACSASKAANGTMLLLNGKSGDVTLEKPSEPKGLEYAAQRNDLEEALKEQLAPLIVSKTQDSEWTNLNSMMSTNGLLAVEENDGTQVGLRQRSKEPFSVADTIEAIITEPLDSQTSNVSRVCKEASSIQGEEYASKIELDLIFCPDEIKNFKVVDMSKQEVIDCERHSAAFQPPQTFEELHVVEPPRSIYGKDMASDIDEVLEKLASEFVRQESLSSFLP